MHNDLVLSVNRRVGESEQDIIRSGVDILIRIRCVDLGTFGSYIYSHESNIQIVEAYNLRNY